MKELNIDATGDNLSEVIAFIDGQLEGMDCSMNMQLNIELAVEEIFVNIASYAYERGDGEVKIKMSFDADSNVVSIVFIDSGIKYNPIAKEDPDIKLSADKRPIGGLGIYITKKFFDELIYDYKSGKNILTMKKKM